MSSLPRYAIVLALSFGSAVFTSAANSQTKTAKKAPTSTVAGRITIHGKGAAGIVVSIRGLDFPTQPTPALKATTDLDGNYRIADIPAGNYQVTPLAPQYTAADQLLSRSRGKSLLLAEGEDVQGCDFSLVRGGVITGKVTDADGQPVIEERLTIVSEAQANARDQTFPPGVSGGFQTDDRGIYRIYGIPAGRYKISVGLAEENSYLPVRFGRVAYKRTFHPNATDSDDAKVIEIAEGTEATNIDITVGRNLPSFAASGKVVDGETGQPVKGLRFGLRRMVNDREGNFVQGIFAASNSQGDFRLENVTPGKYAVFIAPQAGSEVRADAAFFEVIDQDVNGLLLKTLKGLSVSGTVVLDGTYDKSVFAKLAQLRVRAYVRNELSGSGQESPINSDGSFRVGGLVAGTANFWLGVVQDGRPPVSFAIVRVERDGVVQPHGVEIKTGEQVSGVTLVVSYGTGTIRGEVKWENGLLPPGARVNLWLKKLSDTESNVGPYNLDSRGHFLIEGLAAGSYEINVNANVPGRRTLSVKQPISVTEGTVSDVVVVLDLKAPAPNP